MENTANLTLPYIMPSQAQKHVTHNEALRMLDAIVQLCVIDRDLLTPPSSPQDGDRYIVAPGAVGPWEGREGCIAAWQDDGWAFFLPQSGWLCFVADEGALLCWTGTAWDSAASTLGALQNLALLGVGTSADATNPFAAKVNNALWAARATDEGGSGDLRYIMNKQGPQHALSLLMQSNWSGRAEIGLAGSDDLSFKVSADGAAWTEALRIDRASGRVDLPRTNMLTDFAVSLLPDSGRFAGNASKEVGVGSFVFPPYLSLTNGATAADSGKFITNNNDYGGSAGALTGHAKDLIDKIRAASNRRYGIEFRIATVTHGPGTASPVTVGGVPYHFSLFLTFGPRAPAMTFHCYLRALDRPILFWRRSAGQTLVRDGVRISNHVVIDPADGWVSMACEDRQHPRSYDGYNPTPLNVSAQVSGDRYLIACPALMAGITRVDPDVGVISGINRWLP
jgi:hypothetical protein